MSSLDYPWSAEAALSRNEAPWKRLSALTPTFHTIDSTSLRVNFGESM